jgi:hypothetical protein
MANNIPEFKVTRADLELIKHLFAFEGCEPLTEELVNRLIRLGWQLSIFNQVREIAPKCEHGGISAYYSNQRDSLLILNNDDPDSITSIEIEKNNTVHFHGLPHGLPHFFHA